MYLVSLHGQATSAWPGSSGIPTECRAGTNAALELLHLAQHRGAGAGHHPHRHGDVRRVGELDAEHRVLGVEVAHHERDDVHRAAPHAAGVQPAHQVLHLGRVHPVVGGPAVLLLHRADEGPVLHPRHVGGVGGGVERVRLDLRVQPGERAGRDQGVGQLQPLLVGTGDPVDPVRLGERGGLGDETGDRLVRGLGPCGGRAGSGFSGLRVGGHVSVPSRDHRAHGGSTSLSATDLPQAVAGTPPYLGFGEATCARAVHILDRSSGCGPGHVPAGRTSATGPAASPPRPRRSPCRSGRG